MAPAVMWFRRDLRLQDNPALWRAHEVSGGDGVVGLFVLDAEYLAPSGFARAEFLAGCLEELRRSTQDALVLRRGDPSVVVLQMAREIGATEVVIAQECGPTGRARDDKVREVLEAHGITLRVVSSPYVVDPGTLRSAKGEPIKVFSAFRRRWDEVTPSLVRPAPGVRWLRAQSDAQPSDVVAMAGARRPARFEGLPDRPTAAPPTPGEAAAHEQLERFVAGHVDEYQDQRDVFAAEGTSRLSASLHFGCLHPRTVLGAANGAGGGRRTFISEICWREFYADVLFHNPRSVREALQPSMAHLRWDEGSEAEERFRAWALGRTGIPLVDASMRQLLTEGWMHNRARMVAASFLVKHLHLDWRWGARWFMWRLVDGDLASNQHGWQWTAGTGTDAAPFHRIFSPVAQAERFDPNGAFIHRYVPELAGVEAPRVFQPGGGITLFDSSGYPPPIVDLKAERLEALRRVAEAKERYQAGR